MKEEILVTVVLLGGMLYSEENRELQERQGLWDLQGHVAQVDSQDHQVV